MEDYYDGDEPRSKNYVLNHWRGDLSLPVSYWVNAVLIASFVPVLLMFFAAFVDGSGISIQLSSVLLLVVLIITISIAMWAIVGTWRSSDNHIYRGGSQGWASVAKFLMFMSALRLLFQAIGLGPYIVETSQLAVGVDSMGGPARVSVQDRDLLVEGPLTMGTAELVEKALASNTQVQRIRLSSIGGRLGEAALMAEQVSNKKLDTHAEKECSSACTMVLVAGIDRSIAEGTKVGFHRPSYPGLGLVEINPAIELMTGIYRDAGLQDKFVTSALAVDASTIWYPDESELFEAGVLNLFDADRIAEVNKFEEVQFQRKLPLRIDAQTILRAVVAEGNSISFNYIVNMANMRIPSAEATKLLQPKIRSEMCNKPLMDEFFASGARYVFNYDYSTGGRITSFTIDDCDSVSD